MGYRLAHLSDLHLLALDGAIPFRLFNKRFSGYVNLRWRRHAIHRSEIASRLASEVRHRQVDHVVITGDLTNLALEVEFERVLRFLQDDLQMGARDVSLVPGNHDVYTRGAQRKQRFTHYLGAYCTSDLTVAQGVQPQGDQQPSARSGDAFPYVRLRGPMALLGISTAVARPPMVASGVVGSSQRHALRSLLSHDEVQSRYPVIAQHHPIHNPPSRRRTLMNGLTDADKEREAFAETARALMIHGHLHRRVHRTFETRRGYVDVVGATSASLNSPDPSRMAGFHIYEFEGPSPPSVTAHVYNLERDGFDEVAIPKEGDSRAL